jgi:hypothetical protein
MGSQRLSKLTIKLDGEELETMPGASIDIGGTERKVVTGDNKVLGWTETTKPSMIECEIAVGANTSLAFIAGKTNITATCEFDTGQVYIVNGGFVTDTLKVTGGGEGGKVPVKISGDPAVELSA